MTDSSITPFTHRGLGAMLRLTLREGLVFDLTLQEARILSRALAAVRDGKSPVDEVFMSPIASDGDFTAKVGTDGVIVAAPTPVPLAWAEVGTIAAGLAALAPEES